MSDDSDFESLTNDKMKKAKRKVLQSDSSDSSNSDSSPITRKRTIKCRNKINSSDSDSSIEKPRKKHRVYKVAESETESETESESSSSDSEIFVNNKKILGGVKKVVLSESESFSSSSASELENNFSDFSDGQSEKCPICLLKFKNQEVGTPDCCDHIFCFECLQAWSQNVNTCPVDRQNFSLILVRKEVNGKIIRQVSVESKVENAEVPAEDPTFCEICGSSDREDRLLLCDGCDLGYHLECLDPPLEFVPIEEWFCQLCVENDQILQQNFSNSPQRNQNQSSPRLIPRTRQIERVRTQIAANRRNIQNQIQSSPDSDFNNDNENLPTQNCDIASNSSGFGSAGNTSRQRRTTTTKKRKSTKKRKKRTPRTYYFDIDENTGQKIKVYRKTTRRRRKKYKRKQTKRKQKTVKNVPKTVKKRLATSLGFCAPQKGNQSINIKNPGLHLGIPTLHLFGQRDQLDYFSDENDPIEEYPTSSGGLSVMTSSTRQITDVLAARRAARRKMLVTQPPSISSIDILGSILNEQQNFHSKNAVLSVSRDGTLKIESKSQKNFDETNQTERVDLNNVETSVTQAPMFPNRNRGGNYFRGGGNSGNQSNYRGNTSNYQGGGNNSYSYNQNNQNYRSPRDFNNVNVNQQQQQNYFGGPPIFNSNNYSPNFPPQNFRGRGPIRFPMRRPLYEHDNESNRNNESYNQSNADYYDRENEMNEGDFNDNDNDNDNVNINDDNNRNINEDIDNDNDNVDIYSDIEEGGPNDDIEQEPEQQEIYKNSNSPPRNLEPAPIPDFESHSHISSENEDLVIDDSEKYDPADPSHDTDDNSNDTDKPQNMEEKSEMNEVPIGPSSSSSSSQIRLNVTRVPTVSKELLKEAVKEVLHEHLDKKRTRSISNEGDCDPRDRSVSDDEDCPNFSIYSAESIDIAKKTDMEIVEPQLNQQETQVQKTQDSFAQIENPKNNPNETISKNIVANYGSDEESNSNQNENLNQNIIDQVESELEKMETDPETEIEKISKESEKEEKCQNIDRSSQNIDDGSLNIDISQNTDRGSLNFDKGSQNIDSSQNIDMGSLNLDKGLQNIENESLLAENVSKDDMEENSETTKVSDDQIDKDESDELIAEVSHKIDEDIRKEEKDPHQIEILQNELLYSEGHNHLNLPRTPIKVAFDPKRKSLEQKQKSSEKTHKPVLSLYDDSDLEEWAPKIDVNTARTDTELEKLTEAISEEERSYTPCLDEKEPTSNTTCNKGISGLDTELISDDEKNDFDFQNDNSKNFDTNEVDEIALEINAKESELDIVKPEDYEEGEIIEKAKIGNASEITSLVSKEKSFQNNEKDTSDKKSQRKSSDYEHENSSRIQKLDKSTTEKSKTRDKSVEKKSEKFKKFSKKERNYRDKENRDNSRQNRTPEKNEKSNKKSNRKERKQDLERYCVRALMADKPRKDQFGRDLSDRNHSLSREREREREKSISLSPRRSRSISYERSKKNRKNRNKNSSRSRRSRSFSRSPRSRRSRSPRRSKSPIRNKRKSYRSASRDNNKSYSYRSISREKRYKRNGKSLERDRSGGDRNNKKSRKKSRSPSYKRFERNRSFNRDWSPSFSRTPSPRPSSKKVRESFSPSWTPPLENRPQENLTVILKNNDKSREKKRDKRKKQSKNDLFRSKKRRNNTPPPSKEVFASGDNILVSVSFNKPTNENEEIVSKKNRSSVEKKSKKNREKRRRLSPSKVSKSSKKSKTALNIKPVAIIDLDNSPFKEITPSPKDIIILSDSDPEKSNEKNNSQQKPPPSAALSEISENLEKSPSFCQGGPKTPPEPQIKFLISKQTNSLRPIMNPLHDPSEQNENDNLENDEMEENFGNKGPNTPPEPPNSPPSSPDAYDPFEPTKSRSPTPEPENNTSSAEKQKNDTDLTSQLSNTNDNLSNMDNSKDKTPENNENSNENNENGQENSTQPIGVVINQQVQQANVFPTVKPLSNMATSGSQSSQIITSTPTMANNTSLPRANLFNTPSLGNTSRIIVLPTTSKNSPAKASPAKLPIKSTPIKPMQSSKTMISKLPVPNVKPVTPLNRKNSKSQSFEKSNDVIEVGSDFDSPYSPGSSDYEDLFEPPAEISQNKISKKAQNSKSPAKNASTFDNLFASSPVYRKNTSSGNKKSSSSSKNKKKGTPQKHNKSHVGVKIDEDNLKILDDLPNSAVQLAVKDKFLKKLNRQERVVEEVKHVLKPHYNKKHITKEQYKDILRRSVPKICHNKSGEINPKKIQNLIEAYVKRARHQNKTSNNSAPQIQQTAQGATKPAKTTFWS